MTVLQGRQRKNKSGGICLSFFARPLSAVAAPWEDVFPGSSLCSALPFAYGYTALSLLGAAQLLRLQFQFVKLGPVQTGRWHSSVQDGNFFIS